MLCEGLRRKKYLLTRFFESIITGKERNPAHFHNTEENKKTDLHGNPAFSTIQFKEKERKMMIFLEKFVIQRQIILEQHMPTVI